MTTLQIIQGLNAAIALLINTGRQLCGGSQTIWNIVKHAENHLDAQIKDLLIENR